MRDIRDVFKDIQAKRSNPDRRAQVSDTYVPKGARIKPKPVWKQLRDYMRLINHDHAAAIREDLQRRNGAKGTP